MEQLILFLVFGFVMFAVSSAKGFNPLRWFFAAGVLGLIILIFLPSAKAAGIDEAEKNRRIKKANTIGGVISIFALIFTVILLTMLVEASSGPDEVGNIFLFSLIPASGVVIGIAILLIRKKIKWESKLFFGNFFAGAAIALIICLIEVAIIESTAFTITANTGVNVFDEYAWLILSIMYLQFVVAGYLIGLAIWRKKIDEKKNGVEILKTV